MRVRRIAPVDLEATTVAAIVDGAFGFYGGPYWQWKYADPGGPDAVIMLAEEGAEIVGCNHYLVVPYQLGEHTLTGLAGGDLFVNPEFRRQHIATDLSLESRMLVTEAHPEADFVVMFTWQALGSHYEKLLGYTKLKPGYQQWSKRLSWEPQLARLTEANEGLLTKHPGLARANHALRLEVKGAPPLDLKVGPEGFTPGRPDGIPKVRLRVSGPDALSFGRSGVPLVWMVAAILTRRWRFGGSPKALRQATSVIAAYREALRTLK